MNSNEINVHDDVKEERDPVSADKQLERLREDLHEYIEELLDTGGITDEYVALRLRWILDPEDE